METIDQDAYNKGELVVALKFLPQCSSSAPNYCGKSVNPCTLGKLLVLVYEARNLNPTRSNGTSDPFCKR